jgi:hypothetical protein
MSDTNPQVEATSSNQPAQSPPTAAAAKTAAPQGAPSGTFGSVGALKAQDPKFWNEFMMGLAQTICSEMQKHQERLKEIMQKARDDLHQR